MWYWSAVFSDWYTQGAESKKTSDYKEVKAWFNDNKVVPSAVKKARAEIEGRDFTEVKIQSSALHRGVMSLFALAGAKDFVTGRPIEDALVNQKDHIVPRSLNLPGIDSVLNLTWMSKETNEGIKRAKKPAVYIREFVSDKYAGSLKSFLEVLKTHLIDKKTFDSLSADAAGFSDFMKYRQELIRSRIKELIGWTEVQSTREPALNDIEHLIQMPEDERLEFKSTFKSNLETNKSDDGLKFSALKSLAGFLNAKGGTLVIGYDEKGKTVVGLEKDYKLMKHGDRDSFELEFWSYIEANIDKEIVEKTIDLRFEANKNKEIAVIEVKRSQTPVYIKKNGRKILYVRRRNKTEDLEDPEAINKYIEKHF